MYYLADFAKPKKEERKNDIHNNTFLHKVGGVGYLGLGGYTLYNGGRRALPRLLGVRLESHSTSKENAKNILKNGGYLDASKMGKVTGKATPNYGGNYSFITGRHPDQKSTIPFMDRLSARGVRKDFRTRSQLSTSQNEELLRENFPKVVERVKKLDNFITVDQKEKILNQTNKLYGKQYKNLNEVYSDLDTLKKNSLISSATKRAKIKAANRGGKSLYVGGSDDFFRKNFTSDIDAPELFMKTNKKIPFSGNRASATINAIKREGLLNLMGKNKTRVATGAALLGGTGYLALRNIKKGLFHLRYDPTKKNKEK